MDIKKDEAKAYLLQRLFIRIKYLNTMNKQLKEKKKRILNSQKDHSKKAKKLKNLIKIIFNW